MTLLHMMATPTHATPARMCRNRRSQTSVDAMLGRIRGADGARWLWELAAMHFPDAIQILDWYHLAEHVHAAAAVLFGEGTPNARRWSERARRLGLAPEADAADSG